MSIRGVQEYVMLEPEIGYLARLDGIVPKGITGAITAGNSASFRRQVGLTGFVETVPQAQILEVQGDGGVIAQYQRRATGVITIAQAMTVFDQILLAALNAKTIYTEGAWEVSMRSRRCQTFKNLAAIVSGRAISQEAGTVGEEGWYTIFYWNLTGIQQPFNLTIAQITAQAVQLSANEVDQTWWEEDLNTNYDQDNAWASDPIIADYPIMADTYIGDGQASQTVTLSQTPAAADGNSVQVWEDGVKATYTTHYTVVPATKVLTYETAGDPASASDNVIVYEYVPEC